MKRKLVLICLCCFVLASFVGCGENEEEISYTPSKVVARTGDYYLSVADGLTAGEDDWVIIGLARNGREVPEGLFDRYYGETEQLLIDNNGVLPDAMNSVYARMALTVTAMGKDPGNVGGYDLFAPLNDVAATESQGLNGASWALIAAKGCGKAVPEEEYLGFILGSQHEDGGFALSEGLDSDPDITAMMLQALSFFAGRDDVDGAAGRALNYLSGVQFEDGGFGSMDEPSAESCAQVITALAAQNIPVDDERFVKNGNTVFDALMTYYLDDATFAHSRELGTGDKMATEQAYYAVVALDRMEKGETFLYDLTD
ncbi:MAG: prenyltransferase/squalene oxidase repeat-containing protein [Bacillota bacterium]